MAHLKTYRAWFKDDSMLMVCAVNEKTAKEQAEAKSREDLKGAYFDTPRERAKASTVKTMECLD